MARMQRSLFAQLNALTEEISQGAMKVAGAKSASPTPADPGTYLGASSHPSANVDNDAQPAHEGERSRENEADVKKQEGVVAVDNTPELSQDGRQNDVQLNIGVSAKPTGEDPANEKDFKGTKDDPGTSSPVKANDGEKYSGVSFKEACAKAGTLGNDILANLINFGENSLVKASEMPEFLKKKIEEKKDKKPAEGKDCDTMPANKPEMEKEPETEDKAAAFRAGYELAAHLGWDKEASEAAVQEICANALREADAMADLVLGYVYQKSAEADPTDDAAEGEDHGGPETTGAAAGAAAPAGLEAMMQDGGDDIGGAPAGGDEDAAMQELAMALEELGIPPEALIHAAQSQADGGGDLSPSDAGVTGKTASDQRTKDMITVGQAVLNFKHAGKFQFKEARTKKSRELRDMMKQHVLELVTR